MQAPEYEYEYKGRYHSAGSLYKYEIHTPCTSNGIQTNLILRQLILFVKIEVSIQLQYIRNIFRYFKKHDISSYLCIHQTYSLRLRRIQKLLYNSDDVISDH